MEDSINFEVDGLIRPETLIRVYKMMQSDPLKLWLARDLFAYPKHRKIYFNTLIRLGLIERVDAYSVVEKRHLLGYKLILPIKLHITSSDSKDKK